MAAGWLKWTALAAAAALAACGGAKETQAPTSPAATPASPEASTPAGASRIDEAALRRRIETLASDAFEGRAPATPGGLKTREYLVNEMQAIGLAPGVDGGYEQPVPLVESTIDPEASFLEVGGQRLDYRSEAVYWTKRVVAETAFEDSDVVFVGYGVVAPEYGWNDYAGLDVAGKTVVMLVNDPGFATGDASLFNGRAMTYYGRWTYKYEEAARQGAAAAIVIHQTEPAAYPWGVVEGGWTGPQLDLERADAGAGRVAMEAWITEEAAKAMFAKAGADFDEAVAAAKTRGFAARPLGLKAGGRLVNTIRRSQSANVVGVLPGAERPDEYVLYMAHWDHLGVAVEENGDAVANGAVDNATGTAGILAIAEAMAARPEPLGRSVMIVAVTAEESGLLGSAYFAEAPPVPLSAIVGGVNVDALLPTPTSRDVVVIGHGASELEDVLEAAATVYGQSVRPDAAPEKGSFYRSDHISLAKKGVPMIYVKNGVDLNQGGEAAGMAFAEDYTAHRYHKPGDEYDPSWDLSGIVSNLTLLLDVGETLASSSDWPNWYEGAEFRALRDAQRAGEAGAGQ